MTRALYRDDREHAKNKERELLEKRECGGTYLELGTGSNPTVTYSEWTCKWCGRTLKNTHATCKVAMHKQHCDERPHPDQAAISGFAKVADVGGDSE